MTGISQHRRWLNRYEYFLDEYEYYNFDPAVTTLSHSRKGRSKKEASLNTNRSNPAGHERKVLAKLQNAERKKKMCNIKTTEKWSRFVDFHGNQGTNWPKPVAYKQPELNQWNGVSREKCLFAALSYSVLMWFKISSKTEIPDIETFF